jgi:hypothetical protein
MRRNKTKQNNNKHCACRRLLCVHKNKTKKDDDECQLVINFFGCKETKQKKTMTNTNLSSSFLNAQKQNKRDKDKCEAHRHFL